MPQDGARDVGRHRRNQLCNRCGKAEGDPIGYGQQPDTPVTLLQDLEKYSDDERIFQGPRTPDNPLPDFLFWCSGCAQILIETGDPVLNFRELGYQENDPSGPYAQALRKYGRETGRIISPRED